MDGYRFEEREDKPGAGDFFDVGVIGGTYVVPCSEQLEPLLLHGPTPEEPIAVALANILIAEDRQEAILNFAERYGLPFFHDEVDIRWFENIADAVWEAAHVGCCLGFNALVQRLPRLPHVTDQAGSDGVIFGRARNLHDFIWAEFLRLVEADYLFRSCDNCDKMYVSKVKRKEKHHFCSSSCSTKLHNDKQGARRRDQLEKLDKQIRLEIKRREAEAAAHRGRDPARYAERASAAPQAPRRCRRAG